MHPGPVRVGLVGLESSLRVHPVWAKPLEVRMKLGSFLATAFLGIVSLAHLLRVVLRLNVQIASFQVPQWMSGVAFLFCGALAILLYREQGPS